MSAVLAVDLGTKRIGVAVCEGAGLPAVPLAPMQHKSRAESVRHVARLAKERAARTIVVGYPLRLDGTRGPSADSADKFIHALRDAFDGNVVAVDERLTTAAAAKKLQSLELSGSKRRKLIDSVAALEILQSYLSAKP